MKAFLHAYCERSGGDGLFAEPLNVLSNAAFLFVAIMVARQIAADSRLGLRATWDVAILAAMVLVIGLGSASWHLWPTRATLLADVVPISLFIHVYLAAFSIRVLGLAWPWAALIVGGFIAFGVGLPMAIPIRGVGGLAAYLPAYAMLAVMTAVLHARRHRQKATLLTAFGVWTVSLALRYADRASCAVTPTGTHFFWHLLNAVVLSMLLGILVEAARGGVSGGGGRLDGPLTEIRGRR